MDQKYPRFEDSTSLQDELKKANEVFIELLLTASRTSATDPNASAILGIGSETLLEYSNFSRSKILSASRFGAPLFVPRINEPAVIRQIFSAGFSEASFLQTVVKTFPLSVADRLTSSRLEVESTVQESLKKMNLAFVELLLSACKKNSNDPIAGMLLGIDSETLQEYSKVSKSDLLSSTRLGFPLFSSRFTESSVLRKALTTGFSSASVISTLTRNFKLPHFQKSF